MRAGQGQGVCGGAWKSVEKFGVGVLSGGSGGGAGGTRGGAGNVGPHGGHVETCQSRQKAHIVNVFPLRAAPLLYSFSPITCAG